MSQTMIQGKRMPIRRDDRCGSCGDHLAAGTVAHWFADEKVVRCIPCVVEAAATAARPLPPPDPTARAGAAGTSARREHDKRSARERRAKEQAVADDEAWRRSAKDKHPIGGRIVAALTPRPTVGPESQATSAWAVGAEGEERVAEFLSVVHGIVALHDRRIPGTAANIDHLVVSPSGVFVVDAKKYQGRVEIRTIGGLFSAHQELWIGGRNRSSLVGGMGRQVDVVRSALGSEFAAVPVRPVLCFVGAEWSLFPRPKTVDDVLVLWPGKLAERVAVDGPWSDHVAAIGRHLDRALAPS